MKLQAIEDTDASRDLISSLPPIAASLHDRFLRSHCSSCFLLLPKIPPSSQNAPPIPCTLCDSVLYCSSRSSSSDHPRHVSSSECLLLRIQSHPSSADVRAALRLLHSLQTLPSSSGPGRLGGLFASSLDEVLGEEESEAGTRIRQGAELMKRVRSAERAGSGEMEEEEVAMWAVLANAVDVQVGEGAAPGIAVYGPGFSWLDHNCSPNACYRFEPSGPSHSSVGVLVSPAGAEEPPEMWELWIGDESKLIQGLTIYGPRITVRSIKPIKKGEEVSITYTDLLQPKCDARNMDSNHDYFRDADYKELGDFLDQTISEFMSDGSPEVCCERIENLLSHNFQYCQFQEPATFLLHPLHYLSLNAYITLASVYRILGSNMTDTGLGEGDTQEAFKMHRAAAGYSLLLAGATHHLFLSEPSLITSTTVFWVSAGESIMDLVRSSCRLDLGLVSHNSWFMPVEDPFASMDDCKATSMRFHECMLSHLTRSWMYLVEGFSYLENIESPIDFSWLGKITKILTGGKSTDLGKHFEYRCRPETGFEEEMRVLFQLAVYCLTYGKYLANICYGPQCYLSDKVGNLLSIRSLGTG